MGAGFAESEGGGILSRIGSRVLGDEAGAIGPRFSGDQDALIQLAKEAKQVGGLDAADAQVLLDWADELGLSSHEVMTHAGRSGFGGSVPHITVGPVRHIPVFP